MSEPTMREVCQKWELSVANGAIEELSPIFDRLNEAVSDVPHRHIHTDAYGNVVWLEPTDHTCPRCRLEAILGTVGEK